MNTEIFRGWSPFMPFCRLSAVNRPKRQNDIPAIAPLLTPKASGTWQKQSALPFYHDPLF